MSDFIKGLIIGIMVVALPILFIGAGQDSDVGRWEYLDIESTSGLFALDTKTGTLAIWSSEEGEEKIVHINFSTGKREIRKPK